MWHNLHEVSVLTKTKILKDVDDNGGVERKEGKSKKVQNVEVDWIVPVLMIKQRDCDDDKELLRAATTNTAYRSQFQALKEFNKFKKFKAPATVLASVPSSMIFTVPMPALALNKFGMVSLNAGKGNLIAVDDIGYHRWMCENAIGVCIKFSELENWIGKLPALNEWDMPLDTQSSDFVTWLSAAMVTKFGLPSPISTISTDPIVIVGSGKRNFNNGEDEQPNKRPRK